MTFHNGHRLKGTWKDNKVVGQATYTFSNGTVFVGSIQDGKFVCRDLTG